MTTGSRRVHDFCWINLMTPDGEAAKAFFAGVFGWTYGEMPGVPGGSLILVEGQAAGALMDIQATGFPPGTPPVVGAMVKVADADATVARAKALGGQADAVFTVMENGRMAMITDPNGAVLGLWQPLSKDGFECDSHAHGAPSWFETLTNDAARAVAFYTELFGWSVEEQRPVPGMSYQLFKQGDVPVAGAMQMKDVPPHWGVSFAANDADDVVRRAVEGGAEVCMPVQALQGVGRFALLKSPQGVSFHLIEWAR